MRRMIEAARRRAPRSHNASDRPAGQGMRAGDGGSRKNPASIPPRTPLQKRASRFGRRPAIAPQPLEGVAKMDGMVRKHSSVDASKGRDNDHGDGGKDPARSCRRSKKRIRRQPASSRVEARTGWNMRVAPSSAAVVDHPGLEARLRVFGDDDRVIDQHTKHRMRPDHGDRIQQSGRSAA